jgi:formate dehydrogenase major subunit
MPQMFCEVSPQLAAERGLRHGGWATISTARGEIEARVLVTRRMPVLRVRGRVVHHIGLPYHWSYTGRVQGDAANDLIGFVADPNVHIQESKAFTGDIAPGRLSRKKRAAFRGQLRGSVPEIPRDLPEVQPIHGRVPKQHEIPKE